MITKEKAPAKAKAVKKVKQHESTKIIVSIEFKARQKGKIIALDFLPDGIKKLILAKIALFSLELETIVNRSKVGGLDG